MADLSAIDIALEAKVAFLRQPTSYPDPTWRVEAIETHMSWVFLTDRYAYKLKKPVHYEPLDFRSHEARRHFCEEEVRLNRRLAPDVYLRVEPLCVDGSGHMLVGDAGTVIDWLVLMRRLPASRMLDHAIRNGDATAADMDAIAARLATFYLECEHVTLAPEQYRSQLSDNVQRHGEELRKTEYYLPGSLVDKVCKGLTTALQEDSSLFDARVEAGRIVEGHGDLRPEHVCLGQVPLIIDCLEFSRELRILDAGDEVAFLALECERLGTADLGNRLLCSYQTDTGDDLHDRLVSFYQGYRTLLRATIAVRHLNEEKFRYSPHWRRRAIDYLTLGEQKIASFLPRQAQ